MLYRGVIEAVDRQRSGGEIRKDAILAANAEKANLFGVGVLGSVHLVVMALHASFLHIYFTWSYFLSTSDFDQFVSKVV